MIPGIVAAAPPAAMTPAASTRAPRRPGPALLRARRVTVFLRKLPGMYRIVELVRRACYDHGTVVIEDFDGSIRLTVDLGEHMGSQLFWLGFYSRDSLAAMDRLLRPGDVLIDGGANMGEVSLFAAKRVGAAGKVFAFEPLAAIADACAVNLALNAFPNIELVRQGLSDCACASEIFVPAAPYEDGTRHGGLATLYRSDARGLSAGTVALTTIDSFVASRRLSRVSGIKLDIEGAEFAALRGAVQTIQTFRPWLIVEIGRLTCQAAGYAPQDILRFIESFGYLCHRIGRRGRLLPISQHGLGFWQDVVCLPS